MQILSAKGSLYVTRPTVMTYTARREDLQANAAELFAMVSSGAIEIVPSRTYPLARRGAGASRSGSAQDDRLDRPHSLTRRSAPFSSYGYRPVTMSVKMCLQFAQKRRVCADLMRVFRLLSHLRGAAIYQFS